MNTGDQKLFDLSFLEQMDDKDFLISVLDLYLTDTGKDINEMNHSLETGSLEGVYKTAHKLKSSTGMLQANTLFTILESTERIAKGGVKTNELAELLKSGEREFEQLKIALELHLEQLKSA